MKREMKRGSIRKLCYSLIVLALFGAVMLVLTHTAQNGMKTTKILPDINPNPVYVTCEAGETLEVSLEAAEDFMISGFQALLVNIAQDSRGTLHFTVTDASSEILISQVIPVETITPGKWFTISGDASFTAGERYSLSVYADGSSPYFMQVPKGMGEVLPFTETVTKNGEVLECGISLGIDRIEPDRVTYGDIFYYSVPFTFLLAAVCLLCIWAGYPKVKATLSKVPFETFIRKYGNDLFLLLLFACICISIYSRAYLKGVYISSDSAGYLREAVNLTAGNGFSYDGLAGYHTWFANWPILYPALIAAVMFVSGAGAYLSSKIVAMITAGLVLLLLRRCFGKDAWLYGLCLTNIGYLNLSYYTWSEIPFILFLLCFALILANILKEENPAHKWYIALGIAGICCFLTRYYGIFVWIVTGFYLLILLISYRKNKKKEILSKFIRLGITAFVSGMLSVAYLLMNKVMNGMASGVSRTMWWDDYRILTDDLIESLLTEFFNIFSLQMPELIEGFPYQIKLFAVIGILAGLGWLIRKNCRHFTKESVLIVTAVAYDVIFIGIRYVSSMDSFYFRFFEPATFLLCIGLLGLLLPYLRGKKGFHYFAGMMTLLLISSICSIYKNGGMDADSNYYLALEAQWEEAYSQIPERSVVIFSDIDFRSSYYRPDVVEGMITPQDDFEDLQNTYYGSDYLCIRAEFAAVMLDSGEYRESVSEKLREGLTGKSPEDYVVIPLGEYSSESASILSGIPEVTEQAADTEEAKGTEEKDEKDETAGNEEDPEEIIAVPVTDPESEFNLRVVYAWDGMEGLPPELYYANGISEANDWKSAYLAFLDLDILGKADTCTYSLIYVNDDDIPEMVVDSGFEAGGCQIVSYNDKVNGGTVEVLQTDRRMFDYIEKNGILCNYGGNTGSYFDYIYELGDNGWLYITGGEYHENYDDLYYDEDGEVIGIGYLYAWGGEEVSEEMYETALQASYDREKAVEPSQNYYILQEMRSLLETGNVASAQHRYELIVKDVTWTEAYDSCKEKGGYLATILSMDELEHIQDQIMAEEKTGISFWVGANNIAVERKYYYGYHWLEPGMEHGCDMLDLYNALWKEFWFEDEPSYRIETEEGERIDEGYVMLTYYEDHGRCYLGDTAENVLSLDPSYAGKIGYICEYDK